MVAGAAQTSSPIWETWELWHWELLNHCSCEWETLGQCPLVLEGEAGEVCL